MKLLRKKNGHWITVAAAMLSLAVASPQPTVFAESNPDEVTSQVQGDLHTSMFREKPDVLKDQALKDYVVETLDRYEEDNDHVNTKEEIQKEIQKQRELGLPAYVIQPGDTLSNIADALTISYDELYDANGFKDEPVKLMTGDILTDVLDNLPNVFTVAGQTSQTHIVSRPVAQPVVGTPTSTSTSVPSAEEVIVETEDVIVQDDEDNLEDDDVQVETPDVNQKDDKVEPEEEDTPPKQEESEVTPSKPTPESEPEDVVEYRERNEMKLLDYQTEVIEDDKIFDGFTVIVQEGQMGSVRETYKDKYVNGEKVSSELIERDVIEPKTEIIRVGTKASEDDTPIQEPVYRIETTTETVAIPYETIRRESSDHDVGYEEVVTQGVDGSLTITYEDVYEDGELIKRIEVDRSEVPMIAEVIVIGTKVEEEAPAPLEIKTVKETITIPFKTIRRESDELDQGQTRVVQIGKNGTAEVTYQEVYQNGELVRRNEIDRKEVQSVQDHIILVGTKVDQPAPEVTDANWTTQGFEVGQRLVMYENTATGEKDYGTITDIDIKDTRDLNDYLSMSQDELYNEASNLPYAGGNRLIIDNMSYRVPLTQDSIDKINDVFDYTAFNLEFMKLLNAERTSRGLERMAFSPALYHQQTSIRSQQNAENGRIRFYDADGNSLPHVMRDLEKGETNSSPGVRPNELITESRYVGYTGENTASSGSLSSTSQLLSPRLQAETFFNIWMNSEAHQRAMMTPYNTYYAVATKGSTRSRIDKDEYRNYQNGSFGTMSMSGYSANGETLDFIQEENIETINGIDTYVIRHADGSVIGFLPVNDDDLDKMIADTTDFDFKPVQMDGTKKEVIIVPDLEQAQSIEESEDITEESTDNTSDNESNDVVLDEPQEDITVEDEDVPGENDVNQDDQGDVVVEDDIISDDDIADDAMSDDEE